MLSPSSVRVPVLIAAQCLLEIFDQVLAEHIFHRSRLLDFTDASCNEVSSFFQFSTIAQNSNFLRCIGCMYSVVLGIDLIITNRGLLRSLGTIKLRGGGAAI